MEQVQQVAFEEMQKAVEKLKEDNEVRDTQMNEVIKTLHRADTQADEFSRVVAVMVQQQDEVIKKAKKSRRQFDSSKLAVTGFFGAAGIFYLALAGSIIVNTIRGPEKTAE